MQGYLIKTAMRLPDREQGRKRWSVSSRFHQKVVVVDKAQPLVVLLLLVVVAGLVCEFRL